MSTKLLNKSVNVSRRAYYYRRNNAPFLSGDTFADNVDVQVYPPIFRKKNPSKKTVASAEIIFCPSQKVNEFFSDHRGFINAKILIFGNGDEEFKSFDFKIPKSVKRIYAQNLMFTDELFRLLPIGIENIRLIRNGFPKNFANLNVEKKHRILVGPYSNTHQVRSQINALTFSDDRVEKQTFFLEPHDYAIKSLKFKFIAAPRGNGVDTHRFWEALYLGSIPIVEKSAWSNNLARLNIDYEVVDSWCEENLVEILERRDKCDIRTKSYSDLWLPNWIEKFKSDL